MHSVTVTYLAKMSLTNSARCATHYSTITALEYFSPFIPMSSTAMITSTTIRASMSLTSFTEVQPMTPQFWFLLFTTLLLQRFVLIEDLDELGLLEVFWAKAGFVPLIYPSLAPTCLHKN